MSGFSPSDAALEGFRLTRERPGTIAIWAVVNFLGVTLIGGLMLLMLGGPFVDFVKKGGLANGSPEELATMLERSWPAFIILLAVVMLFMSILTAGIYRLVLRPGEKGFAHLRLGRDELRLTAVNLILFLIGVLCLGVLELIGSVIAAATGLFPAILAVAVAAAPMIWFGVRLSLATPLTFAEHKIDWQAAWDSTKGSVWPLFGMIILAGIFYVMVWGLLLIIYWAIITLAGGEETIRAMEKGGVTPTGVIALLAIIALQLILPVLQWVMIYSPLAVAYQHLRRGEAPAAVAS